MRIDQRMYVAFTLIVATENPGWSRIWRRTHFFSKLFQFEIWGHKALWGAILNKHKHTLIACLLTYIHTYSLHGAVPLEKLTGSQLVKKFPTFYRNRRFITAFTSARYLFLPWASSIQSILSHPTSLRSTLIWYCSILTTLADANRTRMTNTYCVYTVFRYSWRWTVDMSETCRVLYQINLRSSAYRWLSLLEYKNTL
jgi:hypothetical protein